MSDDPTEIFLLVYEYIFSKYSVNQIVPVYGNEKACEKKFPFSFYSTHFNFYSGIHIIFSNRVINIPKYMKDCEFVTL